MKNIIKIIGILLWVVMFTNSIEAQVVGTPYIVPSDGKFSFNCGTGITPVISVFTAPTTTNTTITIPVNSVTSTGYATFTLGANTNGFSALPFDYSISGNTASILNMPISYNGTVGTSSFQYVSVPVLSNNTTSSCTINACVESPTLMTGIDAAHAGKTCLQIKTDYPTSADGVYWIDPDGCQTTYTPMQCQCDMTTDGGGWTMVENYVNSGASFNTSTVSYFPLLGSSTLGTNESSSSSNFGNSSNALIALLNPNEIKFYGVSQVEPTVIFHNKLILTAAQKSSLFLGNSTASWDSGTWSSLPGSVRDIYSCPTGYCTWFPIANIFTVKNENNNFAGYTNWGASITGGIVGRSCGNTDWSCSGVALTFIKRAWVR